MAEKTLDGELVTETSSYIDEITECVTLVKTLLDDYVSERNYRETVDEIRTRESDCDRTNRRVSALITNATATDIGLQNTRIHLNSTQIIRLYQRIDDIANVAEKIAEELLTISPSPRDAYFHRYEEMVECGVSAMHALNRAVVTFVRLLCTPTESGSIVAEIETVRTAESSCDELRNDIIADAFSDEVSEPWVYHRFAHLFDELMDTIEDVTEQFVLISSNEEWIVTEQ
ncbi:MULTISPECIES: DUF47 domain-containing protein [unclassified Natrinema]|uniref:DUF47 domain-containing protein n=1 Tax=unclassified Natrinema TaxID=2622230 RepID=UPI00026D44A0|nr:MULTISPECIES: DUF47 family protein [unclassified Natrinema]AFO58311.1 hypothetical protein NJ7G_3090 [Natrinema sp. J7-2]